MKTTSTKGCYRLLKTGQWLLLGIAMVLIPSLCFSEGDKGKILRILSESPKLTNSPSILSNFLEGKTTTRVIITLRQPGDVNTRANLRSRNLRKQLTNDVRTALDRVIGGINTQETKITNRFKYIYGFSAQVTVKGLQALINNDDVASIEKDRILYPNLARESL